MSQLSSKQLNNEATDIKERRSKKIKKKSRKFIKKSSIRVDHADFTLFEQHIVNVLANFYLKKKKKYTLY